MAKILSLVKAKTSRLLRTTVALRELWKRGGITQVSIAQVNHGQVLAGKRVLITGGSSGIGLAIAKKCLSEGAKVVITGRNQAKLEGTLKDLATEFAHGLVWDVADVSCIESKLDEVEELLGAPPDLLVNNAGVLIRQSFFQTDEDGWDQTYAVNSKGLFFLTQCVSRKWIQSKCRGKVVNIASTGSVFGATYPYRMTKWDVAGLTEGLGKMLSPHGITVNGIAPGRIATEMLKRGNVDNIFDQKQPLERLGLPEEIAELAVFLMSDAANYIVGQTIVCDGGYTLKS